MRSETRQPTGEFLVIGFLLAFHNKDMTTLLPVLVSQGEELAPGEAVITVQSPVPLSDEGDPERRVWDEDNDVFKFCVPLFVGALSAVGLVGVLVNTDAYCMPDDMPSSLVETPQMVAVVVALLVCAANAALFVLSVRERREAPEKRKGWDPLRVGVLFGSSWLGVVCFGITLGDMVRICAVVRFCTNLIYWSSPLVFGAWLGLVCLTRSTRFISCMGQSVWARRARMTRVYGRDPDLEWFAR